MAQTKYDVFISYSRRDYVDAQGNVIEGNVVSKIKDALTEASVSYWFDDEGIYSGDLFTKKIVENIEASDIFLFISSANSNASTWTSKEIATADEFKKHIIPVRIDDSPYNKMVMFRIADIDFIEYYNNPEKGMEELMRSITTFKEQKEDEEERKRNEQQKLIESIKLECAKISNAETKLEIDRKGLLLSLSKISDKDQRADLKQLIESCGPNSKKAEEQTTAIKKQLDEAQKKVEALEKKLADAQQSNAELASLKRTINEQTQTINRLQTELARAKQSATNAQSSGDTPPPYSASRLYEEQNAVETTTSSIGGKIPERTINFIFAGIMLILFILMIGSLERESTRGVSVICFLLSLGLTALFVWHKIKRGRKSRQ